MRVATTPGFVCEAHLLCPGSTARGVAVRAPSATPGPICARDLLETEGPAIYEAELDDVHEAQVALARRWRGGEGGREFS